MQLAVYFILLTLNGLVNCAIAWGCHGLWLFVPWLSMTFWSLTSTSNDLTQLGQRPASHSLSWTLVCFYYPSSPDTLDSPCLHFNPWPSSLTSVSHTQLLDSVSDSCIVADTVGTSVGEVWSGPVISPRMWLKYLMQMMIKKMIFLFWQLLKHPSILLVYCAWNQSDQSIW